VEALSSWGPSPIAPWASRPGARPREIVEPDDLQDLVHQIENMKEKRARDLIATLTDQTEVAFSKLGGVLPLPYSSEQPLRRRSLDDHSFHQSRCESKWARWRAPSPCLEISRS